MTELNKIGLDAKESETISNKLNELLANYQIFYMNSRGFHWNIRGNQFFELHQKFEELYTDSLIKIDEIAERVLTLGSTPLHSYSQSINLATIKEVENISDGNAAIKEVLKGIEILLRLERDLLSFTAESADEGTNGLMSDYIGEQEKLVWMYSAYLDNK